MLLLLSSSSLHLHCLSRCFLTPGEDRGTSKGRCLAGPLLLPTALLLVLDGPLCPSFPKYDPRCNTWLHLATMEHRRSHFSMSACDGLLYAVGGPTPRARWPPSSATCSPPTAGTARAAWRLRTCCHASTVLHGQLLVTSGCISHTYSRSVCFYKPSSDSWRDRPRLGTPQGWHCVATTADHAYVLGGSQLGPHG